MKKVFIILSLATITAACSKTDCDCFIGYVPNDYTTGYGYHTTLYDVDKNQCANADTDIWNSEMKKIINALNTHNVDYSLDCEPI